jgi:hypothetical protein
MKKAPLSGSPEGRPTPSFGLAQSSGRVYVSDPTWVNANKSLLSRHLRQAPRVEASLQPCPSNGEVAGMTARLKSTLVVFLPDELSRK